MVSNLSKAYHTLIKNTQVHYLREAVEDGMYQGAKYGTRIVDIAYAGIKEIPSCYRGVKTSLKNISRAPIEMVKWSTGYNNYINAKSALQDHPRIEGGPIEIDEDAGQQNGNYIDEITLRRKNKVIPDTRPTSQRIGTAATEVVCGTVKAASTAYGIYKFGPTIAQGVAEDSGAVLATGAKIAVNAGKGIVQAAKGLPAKLAQVDMHTALNTGFKGLEIAETAGCLYFTADQFVKFRKEAELEDRASIRKMMKHAVGTVAGAAMTVAGATGGVEGQFNLVASTAVVAGKAAAVIGSGIGHVVQAVEAHPQAAAVTVVAATSLGCLGVGYSQGKQAMAAQGWMDKIQHGAMAVVGVTAGVAIPVLAAMNSGVFGGTPGEGNVA